MRAGVLNRDEAAQLDAVAREIQQTFPRTPAVQVETIVLEHWLEFRTARVRDFVPLFVRRRAIADLRAMGGHTA